ncbi:hypothetical protein JTB14_017446 [Gonioctena quinquepunctata]|nr:hypothetical protein JTB14_017446 [Gonioctena quinquepunctata]
MLRQDTEDVLRAIAYDPDYSFVMHQISDSDSSDSDRGIRYKTDSIRNKDRNSRHRREHSSHKRSSGRDRDRKSIYKDKYRDKRKKSRDREKERYREKEESRRGSRKYNEKDISHRVPIENREKVLSQQKNDSLENQGEIKYLGPALPPHLQKKIEEPAEKVLEIHPEALQNEQILIPKIAEKPVSLSAYPEKSDAPVMGPALPLSLQKSRDQSDCADKGDLSPNSVLNFTEKQCESSEEMIIPVLAENKDTNCVNPSSPLDSFSESREEKNIIGPALPPDLQKPQDSCSSSLSSTSETSSKCIAQKEEIIGPALPPHLQKEKEDGGQICGPSMPPTSDENSSKVVGPALPPHFQETSSKLQEENLESEGEEIYGPVPVGSSFSRSHIELEERALEMKIAQLNPKEQNEPIREEWMLELPEVKAAHLGLGPRQFRAKAGPDLSDRSSWTDTPQDKVKKKVKAEPKVDLQKEAELKELKRRDKEQESLVKKSKRSKESLVEIHEKKMKKEKDKTVTGERRPFSRETDLQVNRFDEAQKKAVLKKAQLLDTRFFSGESKFL